MCNSTTDQILKVQTFSFQHHQKLLVSPPLSTFPYFLPRTSQLNPKNHKRALTLSTGNAAWPLGTCHLNHPAKADHSRERTPSSPSEGPDQPLARPEDQPSTSPVESLNSTKSDTVTALGDAHQTFKVLTKTSDSRSRL